MDYERAEDQLRKLWQKGTKGKQQIMDALSKGRDKRTAFVWSGKHDMDVDLVLARFSAMIMFAEFYVRGFMKGAFIMEEIVRYYDSLMDGHQAIPDILVDPESGTMRVIMGDEEYPVPGGLDDL